MPHTTATHATTAPTPTTAPIPTPAVAQAHRESREPQGTTLAQTKAQQSSCAIWPAPWTHLRQGTWQQNQVHWQSKHWQKAPHESRRRDLQRVGRTALMYADLDAPSALAKHLTMLAAQGRKFATLKGVVSSVTMCETLGIVYMVVTALHWAICKAANQGYRHPPPRRIWATAHTLQVLHARTSGPFGTTVVALACLGSALCWRVSEAA